MDRHLDENKLWFKFYIPLDLGLVNMFKIVIDEDTKENDTKQNNCDIKSAI